MSKMAQEGMAGQMARYSIHIPVRDNNKREIPEVLAATRRALTAAGFHGRTVIRRAQGDWMDFDTEEMDVVMVDAPYDDATREAIRNIARGVKEAADQEAVYLTIQPIETELI